MVDSTFSSAFENNFYLNTEFITFCQKVTGINKVMPFRDRYFILKDKNISIHTYNSEELKMMKEKNIKFFSVDLKNNDTELNPSLMEYPILFYKPYDLAYKRFDKTFRKYVGRADKLNFTTKILRKFNNEIITDAYKLYLQHMKRLNAFVFPKTFFELFIKLPSSLLFLVYDKNKLIGYSFCFENKDNLYTSIGAGHEDYFDKYINYKLYHEKIKYACKNKLNIHMGLGIKDSGYNNFKRRTGAICLKCSRNPENDKLLKRALPLTKYTLIGLTSRFISRILSKKVIFTMMPFT